MKTAKIVNGLKTDLVMHSNCVVYSEIRSGANLSHSQSEFGGSTAVLEILEVFIKIFKMASVASQPTRAGQTEIRNLAR